MMRSEVMTKSSPNSVPTATTVSNPAPPSIPTGALTLYSMWSSPAPPAMSVCWLAVSLEPASAKARMTKSSLPSSPKSLRTAWLP